MHRCGVMLYIMLYMYVCYFYMYMNNKHSVFIITLGAVYFSWPNSDGWQYLGQLSNAKPSAIFKVGKFKNQAMDEQNLSARFGQQMIQSHQPVNQPVAQVGISVEPINVLQGLQQGIIEEDKELVPKFVDFTQKMVQSL